MTSCDVVAALDQLSSIELNEMDLQAKLRNRKDRKYLVTPELVAAVLDGLSANTRALQVNHKRWFSYSSLYFDTPALDSFRLSAIKRPSRFKVRARTYLDSATTMLEVKAKDKRGKTTKVRQRYHEHEGVPLDLAVQEFAGRLAVTAPYAARLERLLHVTYRRATVVPDEHNVRVTIDAQYVADDGAGSASFRTGYIVETKTAGKPSSVDRFLWRAGIRPVKISKFATGLASIRPDLPSNRWHRILPQLEMTRWQRERVDPQRAVSTTP